VQVQSIILEIKNTKNEEIEKHNKLTYIRNIVLIKLLVILFFMSCGADLAITTS